MNRTQAFCATAMLALSASVSADALQIVEIPSPRFTEAQQVSNEQWVLVEEIDGLSMPVAARAETSGTQRELLFTVAGEQYRIARADVVLADETLVTSACDTVPLALASDTRSASVKGAGESCR